MNRVRRFAVGARPALRAWLATACLWLSCTAALAATVNLAVPVSGPLGTSMSLLEEYGPPLPIEEAIRRHAHGAFRPGTQAVPDFGIGARPVWAHLAVDNPGTQPLPRILQLGTTWIDRLDLYLVRDGQVVRHLQAGDGHARLQRPVAGMGYLFDVEFAPGTTAIYVRAATPDPLSLPLVLMTAQDADTHRHWQNYTYGALYGFLLALIAYNALLYAGLRERSHLDYAIYLGTFMLLNIAYTGHGYALLWPDAGELQRYVILVLMLLFGCTGTRFAARFLALHRHAPPLARWVRIYCAGGFALMLAAILADRQDLAALLAFVFALFFVFGMVALGVFAVRQRLDAAWYFLAAVAWGMCGALVTNLAVWGVLPYNAWTYRALEIGLLIEATLLALAVTHHVRVQQRARQTAEELARIDPLTGLFNRRAFIEQGGQALATAQRSDRPLSLVIIDIDHFKSINDRFGHAVGDQAIQAVARLLQDTCRRGDVVARWGGEEFILLLPETNRSQATFLAERLRQKIEETPLRTGDTAITLTASMGVAARDRHPSLDTLVSEADSQLYRAKECGRNRVCGFCQAG